MLIQLLPSQIAKFWDEIEASILASAPPGFDLEQVDLAYILWSALVGDIQVWTIHNEEGEELLGILTTAITTEPATKKKSLLVYTLFSLSSEKPIENKVWKSSYETLKKYAVSQECFYISAFTYNEQVLRIVSQLGGDTKCHYITLEV